MSTFWYSIVQVDSSEIESNDEPIWMKTFYNRMITEIKAEIRNEVRTEFSEIRNELRTEISNIRQTISKRFQSVHDFAVDRIEV